MALATRATLSGRVGSRCGCVSWQSRGFHCSGRLSIGSVGRRNMLLGVALLASELDARGGIVGGAISLSSIDTYGQSCGPYTYIDIFTNYIN